MIKNINKLILYSYYSLFFLVPLAIYPNTSELFEFNKMILVYVITAIIIFLWLIKMALNQKINFRRTILDKPLLIFLLSQLITTVLSVDFRTSLLGYYSRFHGGLISSVSYSILYWAYVSNIDRENTKKIIYSIFASAGIISLWAILEHFGKSFSCLIFPGYGKFDVSCWVQDVQNRVFATFGQPNWLAAWIVAIIPLTWAFALKSEIKKYLTFLYISLSSVFFLTILYTKSRSGLLAFAVMSVVFWLMIFVFHLNKKVSFSFSDLPKKFITLNSLFLILVLTVGTPWTPKLSDLTKPPVNNREIAPIRGPALEVGGTESGTIRKIVWKGALDIWKNYPVFGTGVETFAFSFYKFRPLEHNLVSEWNFLYNKAHNEYLNFAATTGSVGLLAYLILIFFSTYQILDIKSLKSGQIPLSNSRPEESENLLPQYLKFALFSGYLSILITNFFGFSVVAVATLFFIFPAMAISLDEQTSKAGELNKKDKLTNTQVITFVFALFFLIFTSYSVSKYWYADLLYARGKLENDSGAYTVARKTLLKAIDLSPDESVYWDELSESTSSLALIYAENNDPETAAKIAMSAAGESIKATSLSPSSVVIKKSQARIFANLSAIDPAYLEKSKIVLNEALRLAPTDAQLIYNLALIYFRTGDHEKFVEYLKKSIDMKPNYKNARFNLALYYINEEDFQAAKNELSYILEKIDYDPEVEKELAKLDEKMK